MLSQTDDSLVPLTVFNLASILHSNTNFQDLHLRKVELNYYFKKIKTTQTALCKSAERGRKPVRRM